MAAKKKRKDTDQIEEIIYNIDELTIPKYFVYYDPKTGKLLSITNEKDKNLEAYIEVEHSEISGFFTGEKIWHEHLVVHRKTPEGTITPQLVSATTSIYDFRNNELIHIRKHLSENPDVLVAWNGSNKEWEFTFGKNAKKILRNFVFFVTLEDDFDFLVRVINIPHTLANESTIVRIPFESKYEHDNSRISISTVDLFINYNLVIYE